MILALGVLRRLTSDGGAVIATGNGNGRQFRKASRSHAFESPWPAEDKDI
jgi:hypothetical protein